MQFVTNGPDVPEELLHAHEENRVVFFCGAGISYPAGLPTFKGLVDEIYAQLGAVKSSNEEYAYKSNRFDVTLGLLEQRLPGRREDLHVALIRSLKPKLEKVGAINTHLALLRLSRGKDGAIRLVTTNFDRIFEYAAKSCKTNHSVHVAPYLPVAKKSRWNGLVYLHGLLPEGNTINSTDTRLVVTSGDFGSAYLTERWAARFLGELFRNYVVCFIGYSVEDPVLRYMMDALAADKNLGESVPKAYIFHSSDSGKIEADSAEWKIRGIESIPYLVSEGEKNHTALHETLKIWSETYRDGVLGCERIVSDLAKTVPSASTKEDDYVGRMLWALSHPSGKPAAIFATYNPAPSLEWLNTFSEKRFKKNDLGRFGLGSYAEFDDALYFSLFNRPSPVKLSPSMCIASGESVSTQWDVVMNNLALWLLRHLNDPLLVIWLSEKGGRLHESFERLLTEKLSQLQRLKTDGRSADLKELRLHSPNGIPNARMRKLWQLFLSKRIHEISPYWKLDEWQERLKSERLSPALRLEFRELLRPELKLSKPYRIFSVENSTSETKRMDQLVRWEVVLSADPHDLFSNEENEGWLVALPDLNGDLEILLLDALSLAEELEGASYWNDQSYLDLPSISEHEQNRGFSQWIVLIELLRESWLLLAENSKPNSRKAAINWFEKPYPTFKRLALFAAARHKGITPALWISWLLRDKAYWLWSTNTKRESLRLLVERGSELKGTVQKKLEKAILIGPRRDEYPDDLEEKYWQSISDWSIWLRLAKLESSGLILGELAFARLDKLSQENSTWNVEDDESDEFSNWMTITGDLGSLPRVNIDVVPRKRSEIALWLKQRHQASGKFDQSTWDDNCRTRFFHTIGALFDLSEEGIWPTRYWRKALLVWHDNEHLAKSWKYGCPTILSMPDSVLLEIVPSMTLWMLEGSKQTSINAIGFLRLIHRVIDLEIESSPGITIGDGKSIQDPIMEAINHPIGFLTQSVLNFWLVRYKPKDADLIPADLKEILDSLCDVKIYRFSYARIILASRIVTLFRADPVWVEKKLKPLFNWGIDSTEASKVWEGFLDSPRIYRPLVEAMSVEIYQTAQHYPELGKHKSEYSTLLTLVALESLNDDVNELIGAFGHLPQEGLNHSARSLLQALQASGENANHYAANRIIPFWKKIWPKNINMVSEEISDSLTRMSIVSGSAFPDMCVEFEHWLRPSRFTYSILRQLEKSELCSHYPECALILLDKLVDEEPMQIEYLRKCLASVVLNSPSLASDQRYLRLIEIVPVSQVF